MSTCAFLAMLAVAAATAFLLGLAGSLPYMLRREPTRHDVWARRD